MTDTQDRRPGVLQSLERVGITNLKTLIETDWDGLRFRFTPDIEITIDLPEDRKGVHMSRLIESITESVEEEATRKGSSIEEIGKRILGRLAEKHPYRRGEISMSADLVVYRKTPKSKRKTMEAHSIMVTVIRDGGKYEKILKVKVVGNTVCPHAMSYAGKPHIQRAVGELEIRAGYAKRIDLKDMISAVENSFSCEVYTLLKTEDERAVVEKMFSNPKFVEDVVREIIHNAKKRFGNVRIRAKAVSFESIHRHDVIAEGHA
jgi:GTP cyclohydrolase IV